MKIIKTLFLSKKLKSMTFSLKIKSTINPNQRSASMFNKNTPSQMSGPIKLQSPNKLFRPIRKQTHGPYQYLPCNCRESTKNT